MPMRSFDEEGSVPGRVDGAVEYTVPVVHQVHRLLNHDTIVLSLALIVEGT